MRFHSDFDTNPLDMKLTIKWGRFQSRLKPSPCVFLFWSRPLNHEVTAVCLRGCPRVSHCICRVVHACLSRVRNTRWNLARRCTISSILFPRAAILFSWNSLLTRYTKTIVWCAQHWKCYFMACVTAAILKFLFAVLQTCRYKTMRGTDVFQIAFHSR